MRYVRILDLLVGGGTLVARAYFDAIPMHGGVCLFLLGSKAAAANF